jgi:hypothetical protein
MTKWMYRDWTNGRSSLPVKSGDHAVALLMEHSGSCEYGRVLEFLHADKGSIQCVANTEFSTLGFDPSYDHKVHSMEDNSDAIAKPPVYGQPFFYYLDSNGACSSIDSEYVLPILEVARALKYIIETHDFPDFIHWS